MHRNIAVAELMIDEETATISRIASVFAPEHIPVGVSINEGRPNRGDLNDWWQSRSIPASRQNIRKALEHLGLSSTGKMLKACFGLSLSDHYWVNPRARGLVWDEVNFFDHDFSEDVGDVLFGDIIRTKKINLSSPDNSSDGWLKKRWKIIEGKRCLIKGGSDPFWQQPINEAIASIIMARLGVDHVPYHLIWEDDMPLSICENFLTAETEFISAFHIHNSLKIIDTGFLYKHYLDCCQALGMADVEVKLQQMLTVDYIIANYDRHWGNFGAIRNAKTLEWLSTAPLFDNGSALWCNQITDDIRADQKLKSQPFFNTHDEQIRLVDDFSWLDFGPLAGIDEEYSDLLAKSRFIDTKRRDALCHALRQRVKMLKDYVGHSLQTSVPTTPQTNAGNNHASP